MTIVMTKPKEVIYPESDGQPMADNTLQFQWIVMLKNGLDALFADDPNVFVAGDLLWYPVEGDNKTRQAPDVLVAFGRPKGYRGSYQQWHENNIPPQVVFEILSPGNTMTEMVRKFRFYELYGVEEYYIYDPDHNEFSGWLRQGMGLEPIDPIDNWVSPRLGIRFVTTEDELVVVRPDGERFLTYVEIFKRHEQERQRAEQEYQRAEREYQRAEQGWERANLERQRAERLAEQLRKLGIDPDQG